MLKWVLPVADVTGVRFTWPFCTHASLLCVVAAAGRPLPLFVHLFWRIVLLRMDMYHFQLGDQCLTRLYKTLPHPPSLHLKARTTCGKIYVPGAAWTRPRIDFLWATVVHSFPGFYPTAILEFFQGAAAPSKITYTQIPVSASVSGRADLSCNRCIPHVFIHYSWSLHSGSKNCVKDCTLSWQKSHEVRETVFLFVFFTFS